MSRLTISELWDAYCGEENSELLEQARSLWGGAGLAILSNSGDGAREEEECRFMLSSIFEPICYSHERGVAKPDAGAYRNALTLMCANAGDVLFIDGHDRRRAGCAELRHPRHLASGQRHDNHRNRGLHRRVTHQRSRLGTA